MRIALCLLLLGLSCLAASTAPAGLDAETLAGAVLLDTQPLPPLRMDSLVYLADGRHLVIGGWFEWPQTPALAILPNDMPAAAAISQPASPRFALSPDGSRLAFWKRVRLGEADYAELTIIQLQSDMVTSLGEPVPISMAMHLVWLPKNVICYTTEAQAEPVGSLYALSLSGGPPRKLLELRDGTWSSLSSPAPGKVLAQWNGTPPASLLVTVATGESVNAPGMVRAVPAPDGSGRSLEIDSDNQLIVGVSPTEGVVVDREVRAAEWRPDGQAILYVKDHALLLAGLTGLPPQPMASVAGQLPETFLQGCAWAPDGVGLAYWGVAGDGGRSWRALLGQERITASFRLPREAPVAAGNRLWVVTRFQTDALGKIIEPVWSTLKAMFVVTKILRTPEGIVAEATNGGTEPGVIERISAGPATRDDDAGHITIGTGCEQTIAWSRGATMAFRAGLVGWLEKTPYTGEPLSLTVERQLLAPVGEAE